MRSLKQIVVDISTKNIILFPLIGLFHLLWTLDAVWRGHSEITSPIVLIELAWMLGFTVFWLAACDLKKWGALGYLILTIVDISLYVAVRNGSVSQVYLSDICLFDGLFSFFLLFFYKNFL